MQEIVAKTQAERNNREYKSHFGEQSAEENSYPMDSWVTHFLYSLPLPETETSVYPWTGLNNPIVFPSGSENHANVPVGGLKAAFTGQRRYNATL
jgi:hypothetical protein